MASETMVAVYDARLADAFSAIDLANAEDPNAVEIDGREVPAALLYGQRMTDELAHLAPEPSAALAIACRAQHIRRWETPRSSYPEGLIGYKKWRAHLARFHADLASAIATEVGYDDATATRVGELVRKLRLASDAEAQTLEDTAAAVFLRHHLGDFAAKHEPAKVIDILAKTMAKMSERGRAHGAAIPLPETLKALVSAAVATLEAGSSR